MRLVEVTRPNINYVVLTKVVGQIAWFLSEVDAADFVRAMPDSEGVYEIALAR